MCGIVCYFGRANGLAHVLDALELLTYRAPDSSGIAYVDQANRMVVRRCIGDGKRLAAKIAADPGPPLRSGNFQVVLGHGRWAMVGAVTENNAHPISDRSGDRVVGENGSHNATLMLGAMADQERWWRARGVPQDEPVHRTENTTEVIAVEWERLYDCLTHGEQPDNSEGFLARLDRWGIEDENERSLRLAVWRLREGNAHACAFYNKQQPETLYFSSHNKPFAIVSRPMRGGVREIMVVSDVNAALMLWPKEEIEAAAQEILKLQMAARSMLVDPKAARDEILAIVDRFTVEVIFVDRHLNQGQELFVRLSTNGGPEGQEPVVSISTYDGRPIMEPWRPFRLNPSMVGKLGFGSYTESHIAEIPTVVDDLVNLYIRDGRPSLGREWVEGAQVKPGLNLAKLLDRLGPNLDHLRRIFLVGEGSSWRDALAAAPLMRSLLPEIGVLVLRPVELLNLGFDFDARTDLALEISWSGTTDSLLKVDNWLAEINVMRIAVTGRPQSDLARRTEHSGGFLDVQTGVEVSVATVKGFLAILMTLDLFAWGLAEIRDYGDESERVAIGQALSTQVPDYLRQVIGDEERRGRLRELAKTFSEVNKVIVVGDSPIDVEAELKIEELAQVVALNLDYEDETLLPLVERGHKMAEQRYQPLFVFNATGPEAWLKARSLLELVQDSGLPYLVHTTVDNSEAINVGMPPSTLFLSPPVSEPLQPLIDAPFFFDLAVALAYARGLSAGDIDRPRNLAKSVTTTGAERRGAVEARTEFPVFSLQAFVGDHGDDPANGQASEWTEAVARSLSLMSSTMKDERLSAQSGAILAPFVEAGYDKVQIIGGGQDYLGADSISRSLRLKGFVAEALYTDSAWHGPLATVGGPDADHDCLIVILATDPLFQPAALVDTQVYRTRHAPVLLVVPEGSQDLPAVRGVDPTAVIPIPAVPRPFTPLITGALGAVLAGQMERLWAERMEKTAGG